jgi:hypothetical protein
VHRQEYAESTQTAVYTQFTDRSIHTVHRQEYTEYTDRSIQTVHRQDYADSTQTGVYRQ